VKVIAYTFRLFGNIFAGEVTVFILVFFLPLLAALPMLAFEVFVGFIQAFVFFILSVAFYTLAVTSHGGHEEAH
jgi:F-type H+-transporting ATPase subunit a